MNREDIALMLASIGLPYAYNHFDVPTNLPYICFLHPGDDDFMADNRNYARITALVVELYTQNVDYALEARVEAALTEAELSFAKTPAEYIQAEHMYLTIYNTEVLLQDEHK